MTSESRRQRKVTFFSHARVKRTMHINMYTQAEKKACWFEKEELEIIQRKATIDKLLNNMGLDLEYYEEENFSVENDNSSVDSASDSSWS